MDTLERMYRRLVQNIRAAFPELLTRPFEVSQIYQSLIPYRHNRRELGLETNDEYELTLMQLLSGARGLLLGDAEMQNALRAELESPNPDLSAYRGYATSMISLSPDALRAMDAQPVVRSVTSSGGTPAVARPPSDAAVLAARSTEEVTVSARRGAPSPSGASPALPPRPPVEAATTTPMASTAMPSAAAKPASCRFCAGLLPEGRDITFCPHCGQNLTVQHCPACSSEVESGWKFCVRCGRAVGS